MLLFRSEEHLESWLSDHELARGATLTVEQQWELALIWYADRMQPEWRRRTAEEAEAVFAQVGLTGPFWSFVAEG